ncbi:hypothetical protein KC19_3G224100 [Ceratodon purpureus]|uniref:Thaumatin-like protein n=1 Tax=Ceratodon purpureus TaxID=3225 RepID=A0A8T0ILI5_CERPU|nr:hypothetical protein KC19_3G224100 [Ceratodon purpureus]KAG0584631.1 hypothetical protein KC19_3G224100 [Ceratodon purpureus]
MARGLSVITILAIFISAASIFPGGDAARFTFLNRCKFTVWVGTQPNANKPLLAEGGFTLGAGAQMGVDAPAGWAGRFWGRTGCNFNSAGMGPCQTGDCGGKLKCNGAGGNPPVTLAEFQLNGFQNKDFYDVSLVDGYNCPLRITPSGGTGDCGSPGCTSDLNSKCPNELQVKNSAGTVVACKSACEQFKTDQYCCKGAYDTPAKCPPFSYSKIFKAACPTAYSYAYDDPTSTFTCTGATYTITFCPT